MIRGSRTARFRVGDCAPSGLREHIFEWRPTADCSENHFLPVTTRDVLIFFRANGIDASADKSSCKSDYTATHSLCEYVLLLPRRLGIFIVKRKITTPSVLRHSARLRVMGRDRTWVRLCDSRGSKRRIKKKNAMIRNVISLEKDDLRSLWVCVMSNTCIC